VKLYAQSALVVLIFSCVQPAHAFFFNGHLKERIKNNEHIIRNFDRKIEILNENSNSNKKDAQRNRRDIETNKHDILINNKKIADNKESLTFNNEITDNNKAAITTNREDINRNSQIINGNSETMSINTRRLDGLYGEYELFKGDTAHNFQKMDEKIDKKHRQAMAGISSAMAMASIPNVDGKVVSMGLGGGSYGGQSAMAFGSHFKLGPRTRASTFMSYDTSKNMGVAAGISIGW